MEYNIINVVIGALIGAVLVYFFMKNKTSADPHSFKDEIRDLKDYIDSKFRRQEQQQINAAPPIPAPPAVVDKVELQVEGNVEVFNNRADAETSTLAGAKTYDNDEILGLNKDQK